MTNGRFDRDIAVDVYADYYPEVPIDLLTRTIDRCTKQLRNYLIARRRRSRNQINRNVPNKRCRNGSGLFAACFNREIYRNCPSELDTDSKCQFMKFKMQIIFMHFIHCSQATIVLRYVRSLIIAHRFERRVSTLAMTMLMSTRMAISSHKIVEHLQQIEMHFLYSFNSFFRLVFFCLFLI